ncbi:Uncharacterised protein [BD1-7 clade bacterium]|uniref:Cupin type-2 domain-containing protein n=1 Tax=BD1-7 clade bacterium TaxID=2029982 RepID=A0A5S9N5D2_9GAMM|nr:Uncharacterised protein [BD1-7 clade bacterium]CAA0084698.1 Uncharacterised protein [BD1-7 clade bacterium]
MTSNIISRAAIEEFAGTEKTHYLNVSARRINKSLGDKTGITGFGFHMITVPPGAESTEHHKHYHEDECVFVLEGSGIARIGEDVFDIGPGDFLGFPAGGEAHSLVNNSDKPLTCIVVGERLDHDVADYPKLGKRLYRNPGMAWNLVDIDTIDEPNAGKK